LDDAVALREEMFKLRKDKLGSEDSATLGEMVNLAWSYDSARKYSEAIQLCREALAIRRRTLPAGDRALAWPLATLGLSLLHVGKPEEAEPLLRENLAIRQQKTPDEIGLFTAQSLLGGALLGQEKYAEAEPLLLAGYEGLKQGEAKIPAHFKIRLTEALERLVQLYDATGKTDEAAKWRKVFEEAKAAEKLPARL
jgi:tetratricopeptide (TPR) repeat protein